MDHDRELKEQFEMIINKISAIEKERNELFCKALHIFMYTVIAVACILTIAQVILFINMFEG
jgi:hypothetical protein